MRIFASATAQLNLAVNISARQFSQPDFVEQVVSILDRTAADPQRLKLELTESILVHNMDDTIEKMAALKVKGVGFALDDFGVGYSSLYYLKRVPFESVKIDQSFMRDVLTDNNDATIVRHSALGKKHGVGGNCRGGGNRSTKGLSCDAWMHCLSRLPVSPPLPLDQFEELVVKEKDAGYKARGGRKMEFRAAAARLVSRIRLTAS